MSLLENLALGLRQAGGVLSPKVQEMTVNQDNMREQLMERRKDIAAQQIIRAAEMGAIEPEAAKIQLQRLGYGGMTVGPGIEAQQRQAAIKKEQAYRAAISGLGTNPTDEQMAQVASQYAGPDKALDVLQRSQDRRSTLQQRAMEFQERMIQANDALAARIQQAKDANASREQIAQMQIEGRQQLQTMMLDGRRSLAALAGSMRQPPAPHITTDDQGRIIAIDRSGVASPVTMADGSQVRGAPKAADARKADAAEQRQSTAQFANILVSRLEGLLESDPRSVTGLASGITRGMEAIANTAAPGSMGSQATIAKQTKEQLLTVLSQIRGGGMGRLSNQDMRRADSAIGAINSGTPEGMAQGLKDTRALINVMSGNDSGAAPTQPTTRQNDRDLINKYLKKPNG